MHCHALEFVNNKIREILSVKVSLLANWQVPPRHLPEFLLPSNLKYVPDILVIATQETFPEKTEWEVSHAACHFNDF